MESEIELVADTRAQHIWNLVYGMAQLMTEEEELGALLGAAAHAWAHFHGNFEEDTVVAHVNIKEETPDTPAILTAVK